jgi:hypothetical protein
MSQAARCSRRAVQMKAQPRQEGFSRGRCRQSFGLFELDQGWSINAITIGGIGSPTRCKGNKHISHMEGGQIIHFVRIGILGEDANDGDGHFLQWNDLRGPPVGRLGQDIVSSLPMCILKNMGELFCTYVGRMFEKTKPPKPHQNQAETTPKPLSNKSKLYAFINKCMIVSNN